MSVRIASVGLALRSCLLVVPLAFCAFESSADEPINLAASAEGGHLLFFSSQYNDSDWQATNLIDGIGQKSWSGQNGGAQAIILGFEDDRLAEIEDILINPYSRENTNNWVQEVEFQVSTDYPFGGFRSVGRLKLEAIGSDQAFTLARPTPARFLKVLFLSNRGGGYLQAGEVTVMGRLLPGAPAAPTYRSLATPEAGARVEKFSSQYNEGDWAAGNLIQPDGRGQWAATSGSAQEIIIALAESTPISDVAVCNYAREDPKNWARRVAIEISSESSYRGFKKVGQLDLPPIGDLHTLSLESPVVGRWIKLLFLSNGGGGYLEAARVRVFQRAGIAARSATNIGQMLEEGGRAVIHAIHFAFNSADILPESVPVMNEIAALLRSHPDWQLTIEGHTDNVGGADFNRDLSRNRANAVKNWLVDQAGIEELRLTTVGQGLRVPIASNETEEGRAQNRRVELVRRQD